MPLFMDVHRITAPLDPEEVVKAHHADEAIQTEFGVCFHKYFVSPNNGTVFCLAEGPSKEACVAVHAHAHGLLPDDMIEVDPRLVEAFMGPAPVSAGGAALTGDGALDSGFRVVLYTEVANLSEAARAIGDAAVVDIMHSHDDIVRTSLKQHAGREVRHTGEGIMACFGSASNALRFAQDVQERCAAKRRVVAGYEPRIRVGMTAGEPVASHDELFGSAVTMARRICDAAEPGAVLVSAAVRELAEGKGFHFDNHPTTQLKDIDEPVTLFELRPADAADASAAAAKPVRPGAITRFVNELQRRHVVTVGTTYAIVFFVLLQVADLTFAPLRLPPWSYTLFLWIGILGFPLALVLSWMFDFTPRGVKRTRSN